MEVALRTMRPGDLGWSFMRQAELYHAEFRYSPAFEAYVAKGLAPFLEGFDPAKDGLWVAQAGGRRVGCIAIQHDAQRPGWAKLRWFFVEKEARGAGVGRRLMQAALDFARGAGYRGVHLWTVNDLHDARRVYEKSGFWLAFEDGKPCPWAAWGREQKWEMEL